MKSPSFPFYANDFLASVAEMDPDEVGIFIRLLCYQWINGSVKKDKAARLGGGKISAAVLAKFEEVASELRNPRLEAERQKQADYREQQSQRGRAGAESRWNSRRDGTRHASANGDTMAPPSSGQCPNNGFSSSLSSSSSVLSSQRSFSREAQGAAVAASGVSPKAKKSKSEGKTQEPIPVPIELDTPEARQALSDWREHRRQKRKPLTTIQETKLLAEWAAKSSGRFVAAVNHSIANGWQGLFEPNSPNNGSRPTPNSADPRGNLGVLARHRERMAAMEGAQHGEADASR